MSVRKSTGLHFTCSGAMKSGVPCTRGFSVPIADWMRRQLRPLLEETLSEEKLKRDGLFDPTFVRNMLNEHWAHGADNRKALWTLLCFQLWYDRFKD